MPDTTALDQDLERRQRQLEQLDRLAQRFGTSLSTAFAKNAADGRRLDDVLNSVGRTLVNASLRAALKPLRSGLTALFRARSRAATATRPHSPRVASSPAAR